MSKIFSFILIVFIAVNVDAQPQEQLYGLTTGGVLVTINTTNAVTTPIRPALPSGTYYSLLFHEGKFYTYNTAGQFYRFGIVKGDEVLVGSLSYKVRGLSARPLDGRIFAVVSTNGDLSGDAIGEADLFTGMISSLIYPTGRAAGYTQGLNAVAFLKNSELLTTSAPPPKGWSFVYRTELPSGTIYDVRDLGAPWYAGNELFHGMAIEPVTQRIYCVADKVSSGRLYEFIDGYPDPNQSHKIFIGDTARKGVVYHIQAITYRSNAVPDYRIIPGSSSSSPTTITTF